MGSFFSKKFKTETVQIKTFIGTTSDLTEYYFRQKRFQRLVNMNVDDQTDAFNMDLIQWIDEHKGHYRMLSRAMINEALLEEHGNINTADNPIVIVNKLIDYYRLLLTRYPDADPTGILISNVECDMDNLLLYYLFLTYLQEHKYYKAERLFKYTDNCVPLFRKIMSSKLENNIKIWTYWEGKMDSYLTRAIHQY